MTAVRALLPSLPQIDPLQRHIPPGFVLEIQKFLIFVVVVIQRADLLARQAARIASCGSSSPAHSRSASRRMSRNRSRRLRLRPEFSTPACRNDSTRSSCRQLRQSATAYHDPSVRNVSSSRHSRASRAAGGAASIPAAGRSVSARSSRSSHYPTGFTSPACLR